MLRLIGIMALACGLAGCGYGGTVSALNFAATAEAPPERLPGRAYLLRGLIGDIYSRGMDELAHKIEQRGVKASVHGVSAVVYLSNRIIREYRADPAATAPIILVGHSTGADAIIAIAERLKAAEVPVALAFGFDPTRIASRIPSNVDLFINLYQGYNIIGGGTVRAASDFRGRLINVDLRERREIIHITLDKNDAIHDLIVRKVGAVAEGARAERARAKGLAGTLPDAHSSARARNKDGAVSRQARPAEVTPLSIRYVVPPGTTIELWDSAVRMKPEPAETLDAFAQRTGAPAWAIAQINGLDPDRPALDGHALLVPRNRQVAPLDGPAGMVRPRL
jgi:hypothetical protein